MKRAELALCHDCNVTIYLNGSPILEKNASYSDRWETVELPLDTFSKALRNGTNVLAVEAYAYSGARYFDCGLTVDTEE